MILDSATLWLAGTNTYVLADGPGSPAAIIDAPPDPSAVLELVSRHQLAPTALLVTHGHVDHAGGAPEVAAAASCSVYIHPDDEFLAMDPGSQLRALFGYGMVPGVQPISSYTALADGQQLSIGDLTVSVLHTPGHTPGHCCFYVADEGVLFSGDQLFAGSVGRWDLPGGDYRTLMASMEAKILTLPDDTDVLPGHGPTTTLARERRSNPFLQELL